MMPAALHSTPRPRDVLMAQIRAVGLAVQRPALVATALVALATLLITINVMRSGEVIRFHPEQQELFGVLGLMLPIGVWMGEDRFGAGFLWTLPVDRRWHALARVFAGWLWLMGVVTLFVLWLLALTLVSGGNMLAEESLRLISSFSFPAGGTLDAAAVQTVRWMPQPILWLVPFTTATGTYVIASALALGTRHPLRWIAGMVLAIYVVVGVSEEANAAWLATAPGRLLLGLFDGPYGLDALLTARTGSLKTEATLSSGETVVVWRALPDLGQWATATLLWTGAGLVALIAAASRHREHRRGRQQWNCRFAISQRPTPTVYRR
jgi:hypothetical protein